MTHSKGFLVITLAVVWQIPVTAQHPDDGGLFWKVDLKQGSIETTRTNLEGGRHYFAFRNIPYAEPPLGSLRFKNPLPANSWTGIRNGSVETPSCPQVDPKSIPTGAPKIVGCEDCLFLNVFSPGRNSSDLPVMVWIHGGGFTRGNIAMYEPTHFMKKDVVVVSIQYRLGVFGFLSTEDPLMPGNVGLKDQVMALRWVKDNIKPFGGNPERVTIFGESAGGASVHFHMFSPMSNQLFYRAIAQSGTALIPGLLRSDHKKIATKMGEMLECQGINPKAFNSEVLHGCLQKISAEKLVLTSLAFAKFGILPQVMAPRVDGEFLTEHPAKLSGDGLYNNVDFMTGITRDEGGFIVRYLYQSESLRDDLSQNFSINGPLLLGLDNEGEADVYMAKRIFYHYLDDFYVDKDNADEVAKMLTDHFFAIPMDILAKSLQKYASYGRGTYLYELNHVGEYSYHDSPNITVGKHWVSHGDELQYFFTTPYLGSIKEDRNLFLSDIMVSLWTNFAKTGNPTPDLSLGFKWPSITRNEMKCLVLQPSPFIKGYTREKELEFFTHLPTEVMRMLFPDRFNDPFYSSRRK